MLVRVRVGWVGASVALDAGLRAGGGQLLFPRGGRQACKRKGQGHAFAHRETQRLYTSVTAATTQAPEAKTVRDALSAVPPGSNPSSGHWEGHELMGSGTTLLAASGGSAAKGIQSQKEGKGKAEDGEIKDSQIMFDSVWDKLKAKYTEERMIFPKGTPP